MTEFDKKLIEKAEKFIRWDYRDIAILMNLADSSEALEELRRIYWELHDLVQETI